MLQGRTFNYVIATWSGPRRIRDNRTALGLTYLQRQFESLSQLRHHLDQITVMVPYNQHEPAEFTEYVNSLTEVAGVKVAVVRRPNIGWSYGSFYDAFATYRNFDYYIVMEDDYLFCIHDFDEAMYGVFNSFPDCAYLCGMASAHSGLRYHAAISYGMISNAGYVRTEAAIRSIGAHCRLGEEWQYQFSLAFTDSGLGVYDVSSKYRVPFRHMDFHISYHPNDLWKPLLVQPV